MLQNEPSDVKQLADAAENKHLKLPKWCVAISGFTVSDLVRYSTAGFFYSWRLHKLQHHTKPASPPDVV
jgi:hypothetical protein